MKKDYIVELTEEEADELMDEHWIGELVRCKDCKHRGDKRKCIIAFVADKQKMLFSFYDDKGEWFCADGERGDGGD